MKVLLLLLLQQNVYNYKKKLNLKIDKVAVVRRYSAS